MPPPRAAATVDRRQELVAAARKVFRDKGYDGATVADIVREAGVAQGTFYLYFQTKKDIFMALGRQMMEEIARRVLGNYDRSLPFEERYRKLIKAGFACGRENSDLVRLLYFGADSISAEAQAHFIKTNPVVQFMAEALRRDIAAGDVEPVDPQLAARLLAGMYRNALLETFVLGDGSEAGRIQHVLATLMINALKKRE